MVRRTLAVGMVVFSMLGLPLLILLLNTSLLGAGDQRIHLDDLNLRTTDGSSFHRFEPHPTFVFFGFVNCMGVCPKAFSALSVLAQNAPEDTQLVFVTIDPARDDLPTLKQFETAFDGRLTALHGDRAQIARAFSRFNGYLGSTGPDGQIDHSGAIYLLNPQGIPYKTYPNRRIDPQNLLRDLKHLTELDYE